MPRKTPPHDRRSREGDVATGLDPYVLSFERAGLSLDGLMIWRTGAVVHEQFWWPSGPERPHTLHSATKSFTGTAAGLAFAEGLLDLEGRVVEILGAEAPQPVDGRLGRMRVADLLTMRSGHSSGVSGQRTRLHDGDLVATLLAEPVDREPGTEFVYSSGTSHLLSAVVQRAVGTSVARYLEPRLFTPLGIGAVQWDTDGAGVSTGGNGLRLRLADFLKWGVLHLHDGVWNGHRVLPVGWVARASHPHVRNVGDTAWDGRRFRPGRREDRVDVEHYGYQVWVRDGYYYAAGMFGQYVFVCPRIDTVVAISGSIGEAGHRMLPVLLERHLHPGTASQPPEASAWHPEVSGRARRAPLPWPPGRVGAVDPSSALFGRFVVTGDTGPLTRLVVRPEGDRVTITLVAGTEAGTVSAGLHKWLEQTTSLGAADLHHSYLLTDEPTLARVTALDETVLEIAVVFPETPFRDRIRFTIVDGGLSIERETNVNSGDLARPAQLAVREGSA